MFVVGKWVMLAKSLYASIGLNDPLVALLRRASITNILNQIFIFMTFPRAVDTIV